MAVQVVILALHKFKENNAKRWHVVLVYFSE